MPEIQIPTEDFPMAVPPESPSLPNPLQQIMADLKISGQLPGEGAVIAITNAIQAGRATMSQENRDRWDALQIKIAEDTYRLWRSIWERAGWVPKEGEK